ncbi:MAG: chromosomal replication initiator DnaA [Proteobacteria bacterium]|nr:chromosomal replication initiator DnaA [Pseudomonadota bacterium]
MPSEALSARGIAVPRQLPLPFAHRPEFAAANLVEAPSNAEALAWLDRTDDWPGRRLLLWGEAGCGKTHLLHLWAARRGAACRSGLDLRGPLPPEMTPAGLAIDDADTAADPAALLHTLNAAAEARVPVLLAARTPPARWEIALADLASRLRATQAVMIGPADAPLLRALLARLLAERQVAVSEVVQDWLLARLPRTPAALREAAARLDRAALGAGRAVTRALAAEVLAELAEAEGR